MVAFTRIFTFSVISTVALSKPFSTRFKYAVKESHNVPLKWERIGSAPGDAVIDLNIALKQSNFAELERQLFEVSDPAHSKYGQHLSAEEVSKLVKPTEAASDGVHEWLAAHGIDKTRCHYSPAKDWIKVSLPVADAENLLDTKYSVYKHEDGEELIRTTEWSLPEHLHEHVMAIQPTNSFMRTKASRRTFKPIDLSQNLSHQPKIPNVKALYATAENVGIQSSPEVGSVCNPNGVTPACLRALYNTADYVPKVPGKNQVAFCNYLNETALLSDLKLFTSRYRPDAQNATIDFTLINGGDNDQGPLSAAKRAKQQNAEGNLDGQTLVGIVHPTPVKAYNTGGSPPFKPDLQTPENTNEPYAEWLAYILAQQNIPQVVSNSYGDDEQTVPLSYAQAVCQQFAQLGARGVTVLFASGDNGVGATGTCVSNDGANKQMYMPSFPASCPYVTTVGGTKDFNPEVAAWDPRNSFSSGGGFSNYFAMPSYQSQAVNAYVQGLGNGVNPNMYNRTGRAYPDLAAQGQQYVIVWNGMNIQLDGTSASTPAVAGVLSLVNDNLIAAGKSPLGFLNPWLYSVGYKGFNDITSGSTRGCGGDGFPAKQGWDAVTGFGTPDFKKIIPLASQSASQTGSTAATPNSPNTRAGFISNPWARLGGWFGGRGRGFGRGSW